MPKAGGETGTARQAGPGWLWPALAVAAGALVYANALGNPFVYDDHATVLNNPSLVDPTNWRFVLVYSLFRPIVNVSYAVDRALWGFDPFGFHLTNLLLHLVNVLLVHRLAWHATGDAARRQGLAPPAACGFVAFATASMFAVHPLLTEAVGYVSGRSEMLCATGLLAALLLARRWFSGGGGWPWLAGTLVAFGLALGSKEVAAALPLLLLAYDWLCAPGPAAERRRRLWRFHAPLVAIVLAAGAVRFATLVHEPTATGFGSPWQNLLTQVIVVTRYLGLLLVPVGQSIAHAVEPAGSPFDPRVLLSLVLLAVAIGGAVALRRRHALVTFGALWLLLLLAPSSAVPLREPMAEHRVYLASVGVFLVVALALAGGVPSRLPRVSAPRGVGGREPWRVACLVMLIVGLGGLTIARNRVWASPVSLWTDAVRSAPGDWEPHYQLGDALRESGRCVDAIEEYRIVASFRPAYRDAFNNLGICLAETRRIGEAREAFDRALAIDPSFARAHNNLGALALLEGRVTEARRQFEQALALDETNLVARRQLAGLFETALDDPAAAARFCREILVLDPGAPDAAECVARNEAKPKDER